MKKKKIAAVLLNMALVVLFSTGGFAAGDVSRDFEEVIKKTDGAASIDARTIVTVSILADGQSETMQGQAVTQISRDGQSDPEMAYRIYDTDERQSGEAPDAAQEVYYRDGYCYQAAGNKWAKLEVKPHELSSVIHFMMEPVTGAQNIRKQFRPVRSVIQGTDTVYTLEVDENEKDRFGTYLLEEFGISKDMQKIWGLTFQGQRLECTVVANQEGYMTSMNIHTSFAVSDGEDALQLILNIDVVNYNPGGPVTIRFPDFSQSAGGRSDAA